MSTGKKILLVEGLSDQGFFEQICKLLDLDTRVQVAPPKGLGGRYNSKEGVFKHVSDDLLPDLIDDRLSQLAIIIDADYATHHGLGYEKTLNRVKNIVSEYGFSLKRSTSKEVGLCFESDDGFADLGVWIMPNNQADGMLEDWIKCCIINDEQALFQQASQTVANLVNPKFGENLRTKAEIATWLAWQKTPGQGLYNTVTEKKQESVKRLLDEQMPLFQALATWLQHIFK